MIYYLLLFCSFLPICCMDHTSRYDHKNCFFYQEYLKLFQSECINYRSEQCTFISRMIELHKKLCESSHSSVFNHRFQQHNTDVYKKS